MHSRGWELVRSSTGGALAGCLILAFLSRLPWETAPAQGPSPVIHSPRPAMVAPADVTPQGALTRVVKTMPLFVPQEFRPAAPPDWPMVAKAEPPKAILPAPQAARKPPPATRVAAIPEKPAGRPRRRARMASLGQAGSPFARFCAGKGRDRYSWMRLNGRKRFCK